MNKKKLIITIIALAILVSLIVVFIIKISKNKKSVDKENNYTISFTYNVNNKKSQKISFIYEKKKLTDVALTLYYSTEGIAQGVYKEYKSLGEFKDYKVKGKKVTLYYKDEDVKPYKGYTKEELIQEFTSMGYIYNDKKSN